MWGTLQPMLNPVLTLGYKVMVTNAKKKEW
jgi:hypothetical protein